MELLALGAATAGESGARRMHPRIRPAWVGAAVAGAAVWVAVGTAAAGVTVVRFATRRPL